MNIYYRYACRGAVFASTLLLLSGCQVMSEKECLNANWYQIGFQDGRNGEYVTRIDRIAEACGKVKVTPDQERYFAGRKDGLQDYCRPEHGFALGKNGVDFHAVCPPDSVEPFRNSYREGRRIYEAHELVERVEKELSELKSKVAKAKSDEERHHLHREIRLNEENLRKAKEALFAVELSAHPF
jgi:hypothetical protein